MSTAVLPNLFNIQPACRMVAIDAPWGQVPEAPERKKSHQARVVRITDIAKHPNADTLGIVHIDGYQVVVKLGEFEINSLAVYVQPDSVVPPDSEEFAFMWAGKGFVEGDFIPVKYRRVIPRKFRKEWSEGLLIRIPEWVRIDDHGVWREVGVGDDLADILEITHYEPPEPLDRRMERKERSGWPRSLAGWWYWLLELLGFHPNGNVGGRNQHGPKGDRKVYDVEAFKNYQNVFIPGEPVVVTEKIHGSNARFTFENDVFYVGSRTMWKSPQASCVWRDAVEQNPAIEAWCRAHPGYTLYGETCPTQGDKFRYGCTGGQVKFFLFDIMDPQGEWMPPEAVAKVNQGDATVCCQS